MKYSQVEASRDQKRTTFTCSECQTQLNRQADALRHVSWTGHSINIYFDGVLVEE